jgi:hypothetical protein
MTIVEISGRNGSFGNIIKINPEYGYVINGTIEDIQVSESMANMPIEIPNFTQVFNGPNDNNNGQMTKQKLKKISKRKDPEILKKRFIREETLKRKRAGVRSIEFKISRVGEDDRVHGLSFTLFRNGSIRMSGKYADGIVKDAQAFLGKYYDIPASPLSYNNITASFSMNVKPDVHAIVRAAPKPVISDKNIIQKTGDLKKTSERLTPRVVKGVALVPLRTGTIRVTVTGRCQLEGVRNPTELAASYAEAKRFLTRVLSSGFEELPANKPVISKAGKYAAGEKAPNVLRRGTTCPPDRCPTPYSFSGACAQSGMYIKPNPQGQPCCYKLPKSIKYSKNKVKNAYKKADVKVPNSVKNIFNITNKNKALSNTTHSTNKNFVKVFNDPTINDAYVNNMDRLLNAWKAKRTRNGRWVIRTRPGSKAKFEDPLPVNALVAKARGRENWHTPNVSQMKIDTRQCTRYTKVSLVDIAKRLGIIEVKPNMKKEVICHLIRKATRGTNSDKTKLGSAGGLMSVNVSDSGKRGNVSRAITGTGLAIRIGARDAVTFPREKLVNFAGQLGSNSVNGLSRTALIGLIAELANAKRIKLKNTLNERKLEANRKNAARAENEAKRLKNDANENLARTEKEYMSRMTNLGLVDKKGRGQMNSIMPAGMYLDLAANKQLRDDMRQDLINMARVTMKREKLKPIDFERTPSGGQKGVIKKFMKAFEIEIETKYRPVYYRSLLKNANANSMNKVTKFANTVPNGKKAKPTLKQIKKYIDTIVKRKA